MIETGMKVLGALGKELINVNKDTGISFATGSDSYIGAASVARVEPIVFLDKTLSQNEDITEVLRSVTSIFSGYYLQAYAVGMQVGEINVVKVLDALNPKRDMKKNASMLIGSLESSTESYKYGLPLIEQNNSVESLGLEALGDDKPKEEKEEEEVKKVDKRSISQQVIDASQSAANLSVGHLLNLEVTHGKTTRSIPISVRLIVSVVTPDALTSIMVSLAKNRAMKERYYAWRDGQLSFIRDLVFNNDLIDAERNAMIKDKTGAFSEVFSRRNKNFLSSILSKTPSVATCSNIMVISKETLDAIEYELGEVIENYHTRKKIFDVSYLMLMVIVDVEWEQVTIYHRGIKLATDLQLSQIKSINKKGGTDISEVLKAYRDAVAPKY